MTLFSLRVCSAANLLALTLLSGVCHSRAGTTGSSAELTVNGVSASKTAPTIDGTNSYTSGNLISGNVTFTAANASNLIFANAAQSDIVAIFDNHDGTLTTYSTQTPGLFGHVDTLQFKTTKGGATRAKAAVELVNTSATGLRNVTATVYLSADNTLSADDTKIVTLDLSDYVAKGKIAKRSTVALPFNYKVPEIVKSYLNGKYLIVVLNADNLGSLATTPVVVGPITLP